MHASLKCPKCPGAMQERSFYRFQDVLLYILLYAGVATGTIIAFHVRNVGWIAGPAVIIMALWCGLRVRGARVCGRCGHTEVFRHFGQDPGH